MAILPTELPQIWHYHKLDVIRKRLLTTSYNNLPSCTKKIRHKNKGNPKPMTKETLKLGAGEAPSQTLEALG
jgi:hypothetical protein